MKYTYIPIIVCLFLISSCNYFTDDFFEFLFNTENINLNRECSKTPSFFGEGKSFEIYSMENVNSNLVEQNIFNKSNFIKSNKYPRYKIPKWKKTSIITKNDSVYSFIHSNMYKEKNTCFNENSLINILNKKGNYYAFLYDKTLGGAKLFVWDVKEKKLFLLTTYEL